MLCTGIVLSTSGKFHGEIFVSTHHKLCITRFCFANIMGSRDPKKPYVRVWTDSFFPTKI